MFNEYITSRSNIIWPFLKDPSSVIPRGLILDAGFYSSTEVRLTRVERKLTTIEFEFSDNTTDFEFSAVIPEGNNEFLVIYDTLGLSFIVVSLSLIRAMEVSSIVTSMLLCPTVNTIPTISLNSISLYNNGPDNATSPSIANDVNLLSGHNIDISGNTNNITVIASPGSGLGRLPCLDDFIEEEGLPGVTPEGGNVIIKSDDDCYDVITNQAEKTITITGRCHQCCECDDYVKALEDVKAIILRINELNLRLNTMFDDYNQAVSDYHNFLLNDYRNVHMRVVATTNYETPQLVRIIGTIENRTGLRVKLNNPTLSLGLGSLPSGIPDYVKLESIIFEADDNVVNVGLDIPATGKLGSLSGLTVKHDAQMRFVISARAPYDEIKDRGKKWYFKFVATAQAILANGAIYGSHPLSKSGSQGES